MNPSPESPENEPDHDPSAESAAPLRSFRESLDLLAVSQVGLFVLVLFYVLHEMKPVLLPLVLALMVSLILQPIYGMLRRVRLPRLLAAVLTMFGLTSLLGFMTWQLAKSDENWIRDISYETMSTRVMEVFRPVTEVRDNLQDVADKVEKATRANPVESGGSDQVDGKPEETTSTNPTGRVRPAEVGEERGKSSGRTSLKNGASEVEAPEKPVVVEIREDPMSAMINEARDFGLSVAAFLLLVMFTLAYGDRIVAALNKSEGMAAILERVGSDVTHYLFTVTVINAGLGIAIGLVMWVLGMPNPALWGLVAMFLNYVPYIGALVGTVIVFLAAAASFDTPSAVIPIPIAYFILTIIEGNLVTPVVLGERFKMNPLVVFVWIFAWGAFWGVAGVLIAMPTLVIMKIACENTSTMLRFRRVLEA